MSDPIQSISQSNYILHNIDAKKLYVQEPLFTANSGDAVYVGWRPDETVLWEGNTGTNSHTTAFTLSESFSAFNKIRFEGVQYAASTPIYEISTPDNPNRVGVCFQYYAFADDNNPYQMRGGSYSATNGLNFTLYKEKFLYWSNTGLSANGGNNTQGPNIQRIIGVNRKENA